MTTTAVQALCVFIGAGLGAVIRWRIGIWADGVGPGYFTGAMAANLLGSLLAGVVAGVFETRTHIPQETRLLLVTGFLGGFTTFSAFSLEMTALLSSRATLGLAIIVGKVAACLALTFAGLGIARKFF